MLARPIILYLMMKLVDIMGNRQDHTLGCDIFHAPIGVSTKCHICFYIGKGFFCLNAPVHSKYCSVLTGDPLQIFASFFFYCPGNIKSFHSVFHWRLAMIPFDTLCFVGTPFTVGTPVNGCDPLISCRCFFFPVISPWEFFSIKTDIPVGSLLIGHIFRTADIIFIFSFL